MVQINLNKNKRQIIIPQFQTYEVVEDAVSSFKVKLKWSVANDENIVGFKIYKFNLPKSLLQNKYFITQNALQDLSSIYHVNNINTNLYNLSVFSQNSKINIEDDFY